MAFGFGKKEPLPNEAFAESEQYRADGLASRIDAISSDPSNPSQGSLPFYRAAYQQASGNAAANTAQPKRKKWGRG
ncbi:hypothetical protein [Streptomyces litchfieldiae]|uniref:Uncharacterized protein n=1 Tax=Streptomyces litchfieldiae TaxID=3075543 RepID=A0ABU2N134_9ACTN|nr:hypothetical protein [Streptomyces sp. DSM 44938]MDT0347485.1 hypothetical protein [Streptomyces sp. DSM 44938]